MKSKKKLGAFLLLTFLFLSLPVTADECKGEMTDIKWKIARNKKITINVEFKNTGNEVCNYRVYLYDEDGTYMGKEPDSWKKLSPGGSGSAQLTNHNVENLGKKFILKLYHVGGVPPYGAIEPPLGVEEREIGFECEGRCQAGGEKKKAVSYISEADCYTLLGQKCGNEANCEEAKKFEECKECCKEECEKASIHDPSLGDTFEYEDEFLDSCIHECGKTCDIYYEILRVENPGTDDIRVIDPAGYTKTITIYEKDCEQISGEFKDYEIKDVPQCRATQQAALNFELIFPERKFLERGETFTEKSESGECEIFSAWWERKNTLRGEEVRMLVEASKECEGLQFKYIVCEDDGNPMGWCTGYDDKVAKLNTNSWMTEYKYEGPFDIPFPPWFTTYPPEYYFVVEAYEDGDRVTRRTSSGGKLVVSDCVDDALLLCQGGEGENVVYGVSNATRYRKVATKNLSGGKIKHWILDKEKYQDMGIKKCYDPEHDKNYEDYVYVDNAKYVEFAEENFGKESFFNKYKGMHGKESAAYLYCYKTALKDTKGCREGINHDWYSFQSNVSLALMERIKPEYTEEAKKWNYWQDVDERPHDKALDEEEGKESKLFKNSWNKIFTLSPLLEDNKNKVNWTKTGNGSVYVGAGFERYDACKFSCDAKGENDAFGDCNIFREDDAKKCGGMGTNECSLEYPAGCYNNDCEEDDGDCEKSGKDPTCGGDGIHDCGKICKIESYYSEEGTSAKTTFTIPDVEIAEGNLKVKQISENVWKINHPAFNITERGNLEFEVKDAKFTSSGNTYVVERKYKVKASGKDNKEKFMVDSDIVFNYDLLENAEELDIEVRHEYETELKRDIYRVECDEPCCEPCDAGCCGYEHNVVGCEKKNTKTETDTKIVEDHLQIPEVSHSNITDNAEVSITGIVDQFVDEFNETHISGALNVTLEPDILGVFLLKARSAGIIYRDISYPVKHLLYKKKSSPPEDGTNTKNYIYGDRYGYEDTEGFNFLEQCKKVCPSDPQCKCPLDDPLQPECLDYSSEDLSRYERDDCACLPSGCYPNPCVSNRTFHEEEGSRIANGDFEQEIGNFWKVKEGTAKRELGGHPGYRLKLDGKISQDIFPTHSQPYGEICLEYGIKDASQLKIILEENGEKKTHSLCSGEECSQGEGWQKKCFSVEGNLSQVELVSEGVAYVDNVNLGKFYDFVNFQTFNISNMEYMDRKAKGWGSLGLFSTDGIVHDKNSYLFEFKVLSRGYLHPKTGDFLTYTLHAKDILNSSMDIYTFFRNETFSLFPARRKENLYINVSLRNASKLTLEYLPKSYKISAGSEVTVKLELTFFKSGKPISHEKIYLNFVGENLGTICDAPETKNLKCEEENEEKVAYVETNEMGRASFSFKPSHTITLEATFYGNEKASPTFSRINIPVLSLKSPLLSLEFLILILIFYMVIFSYRFFQPSRADIYHWWEEFKGRKL